MTLRPFLFLLPVCLAFSQDLTLRPTLQVDDTFELEIIRLREDSRRPQMNGRSRTPIHVRVLESNPKGFLLEWKQGATEFDNPEIIKNPIAAAASNAAKDLVLQLELNPAGQFARLRNEAEVTAKLQTVMESLLAALGRQIPDSQQRQQVDSLVRRLMSPPVLLASATRDSQTYFALNGAMVNKEKPFTADLQQPSPFGGGTIPARFRLTLDSLDAHSASLTTTTTYDPQAVARFSAQLLAQTSPAPHAAAQAAPALHIEDSAAYTYNRAFGLMSDVVVRRRVSASGTLNALDGWDIRLTRRPGQ
ncbi:MAG: hypothetical protein J0L64_25010 [Acidobacteria bacterium]|nr:hypothetical protein [Acidobacteriota bacterium]